MKRTFYTLFLFLGFGLVFYWNFLANALIVDHPKDQLASVSSIEPEIDLIPYPDYVTMTFAGDVMLDRGVEASVNKNLGGDFSRLFDNFTMFQNDDISFINLEGPVSDLGYNVGSKYSFRMDPQVLPKLKDAGVDIVSFANNHIGDYTVKAFVDTLKRLSDNGILFAGGGANYTEVNTPTVIEKNNIKTCFLAYSDVGPNWMKATEKNPGILLLSDPNFSNTITSAKSFCDVLVVSVHWGDEYKPHTARQTKFAHLAIDSGADIVVGHHPHVPQDVEIYNNKPIMYSLGNFIFDQSWSKPTMQGLVVQLKAYKDGSTTDIQMFTTQQNKFFQIESITEKL
jgi:poly-gamma-glutamate synthesis protein (capsule biosynthesis protein)